VFASYFENTIYVQIRRNQLRIRQIESNREGTFPAETPFSTQRLLVGEFRVAEDLLKRAVKEVSPRGFFSVGPHVVIHPMEMVEGGLSEVEQRLLQEFAIGAARASKVVIWVGAQLSDAEVKAKLHEHKRV
jgi:hypothetical protein